MMQPTLDSEVGDPRQSEMWKTMRAAFVYARSRGRSYLTYAEWDVVFLAAKDCGFLTTPVIEHALRVPIADEPPHKYGRMGLALVARVLAETYRQVQRCKADGLKSARCAERMNANAAAVVQHEAERAEEETRGRQARQALAAGKFTTRSTRGADA